MDKTALTRDEFVVRKERLYHGLFAGFALLTILVTVGIVLTLSGRTITFFLQVSPVEFFTGTTWSPIIGGQYGVLPLVSGTLLVTIFSALIALPVGLAAAIYLSEYATERARAVLKPALEILAGVPTVIYGYMALVYITPLFRGFLPISATIVPAGTPLPEFVFVIPELRTFNVLSASIVVGIMIIPMVASISEDAMSAVPDDLRQAGYGMGATKFDVSTGIVVPAALSGIFSSFILALSRAIGETMIVAVAMGSRSRLIDFANPLQNLWQGNQPMTAAMVQINSADNVSGPGFKSMFAIGLTLFVITFLMNLASNRIAARYREEYS